MKDGYDDPRLSGRKSPVDVHDVPAAETSEHVVEQGAGIERRELRLSDSAGVEHHERIVRDVAGAQGWSIAWATQLVWFIIGIIEVLVGLRVLLKLIAANPENTFAHGIYSITAPLLAPFFGLTGTPAANGVVLEVPSLIAMLVYALLGLVIVRLLWLVLDRPAADQVSTYDRRSL